MAWLLPEPILNLVTPNLGKTLPLIHTHYDAKGKPNGFASFNILWNKPENDDYNKWQTYFYCAAR
jgi:hypothetical protein